MGWDESEEREWGMGMTEDSRVLGVGCLQQIKAVRVLCFYLALRILVCDVCSPDGCVCFLRMPRHSTIPCGKTDLPWAVERVVYVRIV